MIDPHDIIRLHIVGQPPQDLTMASVTPILVQQPRDLVEGSTYQMVLLDVEFHHAPPSLAPEVVRRAKHLPKTISRATLLKVLGLHAYCRYAKHTCLLWQNRHAIPVQQRALLNLQHGDYVKIVLPPPRGVLQQRSTREVAQCFRRGYAASTAQVVLEAHPQGYDVQDMPILDTLMFIPSVADLDYDRDAMALFQLSGPSRPALDPWPNFLSRPTDTICAKLGDQDQVEPQDFQVPVDAPLPVGRPTLQFCNEPALLQDLYPIWLNFPDVEVEEEGRVLYAQTWYTDHLYYPRCEAPRPVRLLHDPWAWAEAIAQAWDDRLDPDSPFDLYLVRPQPRRALGSGDQAVPHVLIVQHPQPLTRSIHIFHIEAGASATTASSLALVCGSPLNRADLIDRLGIASPLAVSSLVDCAIWHGDHLLDYQEHYPLENGFGFLVIQNHLQDIVRRAAATTSSSSSSLSLLQVKAARRMVRLEDHQPPHLHRLLFRSNGCSTTSRTLTSSHCRTL